MKKIISSIAITLGIFFWAILQAHAAPFENGKCQIFPGEGKRLAIFVIGQDKEVVPNPDNSSTYLEYFCVPVGAASSSARWVDVRDESTVLRPNASKLQLGETVEEEKSKSVFNSTEGRMELSWDVTVDKRQPAQMIFSLKEYVPNSSEFIRYFFYGRDAGLSVDFQMYFVKIASEAEHIPNPVPVCANLSTNEAGCTASNLCYWMGSGKCKARADSSVECSEVPASVCSSNLALHCKSGPNNTCVKRISQVNASQAVEAMISSTHGMPEGYEGPLPECAFTGSCRKLEDLVGLGVKVAEWLFSIIAGLAFVFFVYGGLTMVMSFGNSEKVGQGKQILVAATIGLVITFSAYILIGFVVKGIDILPGYSIF